MKVLADTSVWSLAFRHGEQTQTTAHLAELILSSSIVMIGPVRQELLSGISNKDSFLKLKSKLDVFDDFIITTRDYETAAEFYNICRKHGVQGSHTDFLICAVAHNNDFTIFTTDKDFVYFSDYLPIRLLGVFE
jgi:predicted nucleic acid-binding protein